MSNTKSRRPRPRDLSAQATRQLLLDTGIEMVFKQPVSMTASTIRIADVVKSAGITAGAAYHHWQSQDAYRVDLLKEVFKPERLGDFAHLDDQMVDLSSDHAGAGQVLRTLTRAILVANVSNPSVRVVMGLWASNDPEMLRYIKDGFEESDAQWLALGHQFFASYGLKVVPPMTLELLVGLVSSFVFGFRMRFATDPEKFEQLLFKGPEDNSELAELKAFDLAILSWFATFVTSDEASSSAEEKSDPWQQLIEFHNLSTVHEHTLR